MEQLTIETALAATRFWLQNVVIGENFCPFAKREFERQTIRYVSCDMHSIDQQAEMVLQECAYLENNSAVETTLIIYHPAHREVAQAQHNIYNFDDYLVLAELAQSTKTRAGYDGLFQLATFHPDYCFAGEPAHDASNFTNRSPLPTLHIIREASIDRALKTYKNPEQIPAVNIERARALGTGYFENWLAKAFRASSQ
ncbi:DUF1415 domain-containing protein [Alteromonas flava]|uniref:DUF1415 domain-containing protein n=1 Tax=Alteromonas flava TaxID=2048003 RepID=UPI000C28EFC7|nr:DUF1415 domain-containing protein [Alteromonas flava]